MISWKVWVALGSFVSGLSVILGAFGAHALRGHLEVRQLEVFETAVRYQMFHGLALIFVGLLYEKTTSSTLPISGWLLLVGTFVFSGSLYGLIFTEQKIFGPMTPMGGLLLILGWFSIVWAMLSRS